MRLVKRFFLLLLLVIALVLSGCNKGSIDISEESELEPGISEVVELEPAIYKQLMNYVIFNFEWVDAENIIIQMCHKEGDKDIIPPEQSYVKTFLYNVNTYEHEMLYAGGNDISKGMEDIVIGKDRLYVYDETECQVFNGYKFEHLYDFKSEAKEKLGETHSVNISKDGLCVSRRDNGDIIVYPINELENYKVVKPATDDLIQSPDNSMVKSTWYSKPTWTEDGNNIIFMEIAITEDVTIWMVSKDGEVEKEIDFNTASDYTISDDDKYLIAICEPLYRRNKKEIRIYDVNDLSYKAFLFEEPVDGIDFTTIRILDTIGSYIVLKCTPVNDDYVKPLLLFNWDTGKKKWLTSTDYLPYLAKFSPDGENLFVYGRYPKTEEKHESRMWLIEIK